MVEKSKIHMKSIPVDVWYSYTKTLQVMFPFFRIWEHNLKSMLFGMLVNNKRAFYTVRTVGRHDDDHIH